MSHTRILVLKMLCKTLRDEKSQRSILTLLFYFILKESICWIEKAALTKMPKSPVRRSLESAWRTKFSKFWLVRQVLLVTFLPCYLVVPARGFDLNLPIAFLSSPQDDLSLQSEQEIYNALQMAAKDLNARRQLLPNVSLAMVFKKIGVNQSITVALDEVMRSGAVTVFGHASICSYISSALKSRNRIAISNAS